MNRIRLAHPLAWATLCVVFATACVTSPGRELRSASDVDRKFDNTSYIEEGDLVALIAGTRVAIARKNPDYIPIEVGIVNKGAPGLSLNRESFTLVDQDGTSYPMLDGKEVGRKYNVDVDRRLMTLTPVVRGIFGGYVQVGASLTTSFDNPIPRELYIQRHAWATELIYFPMPEGGAQGRIFELFMDARELDDPVFVRFEIAGSKKGEE
jgi:hypothetical protein